jgi:hypothetical protein
MTMRYLKTLVLALLFAALSATAFAQSGICPANTFGHAPKVKTVLPYTIGQNDVCKTLIFNSSGAGAVNIPAPGTAGGFYNSFNVQLYNIGAGTLTLTPTINNAATLPTINGGATITLATGQGATLAIGDDGNWYANTTSGSTGGVQAVANGGTGLSSGTSGGVLGFTASGTIASSAALASNGVVIGGGAGATPTAITAGTAGQLLQGGSGAPAFATALTGAYDFTNALITNGNAAGTPTHIATAQLTPPALTSCGTGSPTIVGTDEAGIVTMGTSATGCVITFNVAYTAIPFCVVSWIATPLASQSYVTAAATITTTQTSASGNKLQYICRAQAGG